MKAEEYLKMAQNPIHGRMGLIVMQSCKQLGAEVDQFIRQLRNEENSESYIIPIEEVRFNNGEGKVKICDSVRGKDIYILSDVGNYNCTYNLFGYENRMGPDEHFRDIERVLSAIGGKANRVTVMMPLLYSSRQHKRKGRESLDCAQSLEQLQNLGVDCILTFDAHDSTIYNAIPSTSFENIFPTYSMLKRFIQNEGDDIFKDNMTVISPDTGAMDRALYYANVLGLDVGMFYKRRDHTRIVNGKNPIVAHEFLGDSVEGKDVVIIDDMIASGESMLDVAKQIKERKAKRVFICTTYGLFTEGLAKFDEYYEKGWIDRVITTNLNYRLPELLTKEYYIEANMSKYLASIIDIINHDVSVEKVRSSNEKIMDLMKKVNEEK